mmetsp:Transcript_1639/g.3527  ORF Transcript_1639/g.3527 Transcript_1639/m.3527 type:complete len:122 (+) Transcript_1639:584-949(+)
MELSLSSILSSNPSLLDPSFTSVSYDSSAALPSLLSKCYQSCHSIPKFPGIDQAPCQHPMRKHYAKGLCRGCYQKRGRTKKASCCMHVDRLSFARGKCQSCYLKDYYQEKKNKKASAYTRD